jgi:uroporphyrin-III C-methyltransferase/precorrin-2 dehydrogenase/sirohydrochlorin ferrochelatase
VDQLPVFLDLQGRLVVLVGGGEVAARKAQLLLGAGARLRVVAPELSPEMRELCERSGAELINARFEPAHLTAAMLAVAATDDPQVNQAVSAAGRAANVWVNAVDDASASSCYLPAIVDRSPVIIAVGTGGASPTLARRVRAQLEALLPQRLGELAAFARRMRAPVRRALAGQAQRRIFWDHFFDSALATRMLSGATLQATADADFAAQLAAASAATAVAPATGGSVWLIGAGPGDPDLLTLRAQQLLQQCDVVLYDRLVPQAVLERVRRDAERVFVGKRPGEHRTTQARINELLLGYAARGLRVARLKGGDPLVFGRGGEEIAALASAGVPVLVVPGVTAAFGAAAATAIPLTHRGLAQSVCFVTAMGEAAASLDWRALAAPLQTVVFYMGVAQLPRIVERLLQHGAPPARCAAVIERATQPGQRLVAGELQDIVARVAAAGVAAPALLMVGDVAQFAGLAAGSAVSPRATARMAHPGES